MLETVVNILMMDVESVISSPKSVELLRCYSKLYLNGGTPHYCAESQRRYYEELKRTGIERAKKYDMVQIRTCELKHKGNVLVQKYGFVYSDTLTDDIALYLLNNKLLSESDFTKLPDGYNQKKDEPKQEIEQKNEPVKEVKEKKEPKKAVRKPKN